MALPTHTAGRGPKTPLEDAHLTRHWHPATWHGHAESSLPFPRLMTGDFEVTQAGWRAPHILLQLSHTCPGCACLAHGTPRFTGTHSTCVWVHDTRSVPLTHAGLGHTWINFPVAEKTGIVCGRHRSATPPRAGGTGGKACKLASLGSRTQSLRGEPEMPPNTLQGHETAPQQGPTAATPGLSQVIFCITLELPVRWVNQTSTLGGCRVQGHRPRTGQPQEQKQRPLWGPRLLPFHSPL